ncbi:DUF2804 domain-containing protein [Parachitinimonas caeni]|uniref:DUF2804 domain-containing protein n=1 Tax=Parachitinimonas caeni TaxID=3031301 RepID=A0ABT7DUC8_9NEIS|nr:DUF2804 domain-containing protein [Parachitinimonas caeni]MDK2122678.1 DUF2804 domain-containing protein [Parachitinimonas caeni]
MFEAKSLLPPAPAQLLATDGTPLCGRFAGRGGAADWSALRGSWQRGPLWRRLHHKRWLYAGFGNAHCFIGCAVVDTGWAGAAFVYVFDRHRRQVCGGMSLTGLPGLNAQLANLPDTPQQFRQGKKLVRFGYAGNERWTILAEDGSGFRLEAELDGSNAAPWLLAVGPVTGGSVHSTHKSAALHGSGYVQMGQDRLSLDHTLGSLDHSNGLLPRHTSWRWACAHGQHVGFNLQSGYFGDHENALWLDGELIPLAGAQFEFDHTRPLQPWHIRTADGLLDLRFEAEGLRQENRDLLIAASRYVQPIGVFNGWVKRSPDADPVPVQQLLGVTEDHYSRW